MLTITSNLSPNFKNSLAFGEGSRRTKMSQEEKDKREYDETYNDIKQQKEEFERMSHDDEFKVPKPAKAILTTGAVAASGILGGMATAWGAKKSIGGFKKLLATAPMLKAKTNVKSFFNGVGNSLKSIKNYVSTKYSNFLKGKTVLKFKNSAFGKKLIAVKNSKFMKSVSSRFKKAETAVKKFFTSIYNKIKGVKSSQVENVTTNTVAVSGGVASGYTALKQEQKSDDED